MNGPNIRWNDLKYSKSYFDKVLHKIGECASSYKERGVILVTAQLDPEYILYPSDKIVYKVSLDEFLEHFKENFADKIHLHGQIYYETRSFRRDEIGCVNVVGGILRENGIGFELGNVY